MNQKEAEDRVFKELLLNIPCKHCGEAFKEHPQRKCMSEPTWFEPDVLKEPARGGDLERAVTEGFRLLEKRRIDCEKEKGGSVEWPELAEEIPGPVEG